MRYSLLAAILLSLVACGADNGAQDNAVSGVQAETVAPTGADPALPGMDLGAAEVQAGSVNPMAATLAEAGGSVAAAVTLCGLDVDLADSKRQQQEHFIQMGGGTSEQFEAAYQAGHDQATARYEAGDEAQRQTMCEEFRQLQMIGAGPQP